jgi:hypothetical protein
MSSEIFANFMTKEEKYNDYIWENHQRHHVTKFDWECKWCAIEKEKRDDEMERDRPAGPMTRMRQKRDER